MKARKPYLDEAQRKWVRSWWLALQPREPGSGALPHPLAGLDRGSRAGLRRAADLDQLLEQRACFLLSGRLIELDSHKDRRSLADEAAAYAHLALVGGVLAQVKDDAQDGRSLAWRLGKASGTDQPQMSEPRFKRLQRAREVDDLYLQWRRAVQLAEGKADVAQLADDLLAWLIEREWPPGRASEGVKFRWAYDYYLSNREQAAAEEPDTNKELTP